MTTSDPMLAADAAPAHGRAAVRARAGGRAASGAMSFLSLFLLLLAFFILLNSMAQFERTRTQAILGSLNATFNTERPAGDQHEFGSFVGVVGAADALERALGANLRTLLALDRFALIRAGSVISLQIDTDALFLDEATPAPALADLAVQVARALAAGPEGYRFDIEVLARTGHGLAGEASALAAPRAGAVVRAFERAGIGAATMLAGFGAGDRERIGIEFLALDAEPSSGRRPR